MSEAAVTEQPQQNAAVDNKDEEDQAPKPMPTDDATEATKEEPPKVAAKHKKCVHKTDFEKDVVYLYQFGRCPVIPQVSPFCFKVETWLRMTDAKYEVVDHHSKFKSKKGQLPFVEINGEEIADSEIIIDTLTEKYSKDLDENLTPEQKILSHAFASMLNNHTSWVMRWFRYRQPDQFRKASQFDIKRESGSVLPKRVINFVFKMKFKHKMGQTVSHGLGNHKKEEIIEFCKKDLNSLSIFLGEKQFFFGDTPTLLDCEVFAHLCQFWYVPTDPDITTYLEEKCSNLIPFLNRMKERYWSDWEELCKPPEPVVVKKEEKNGVSKTDEEKKDKEKDEAEKETSDEKESADVKDEKEGKEIEDTKTETPSKEDAAKEEDNKEKESGKESGDA